MSNPAFSMDSAQYGFIDEVKEGKTITYRVEPETHGWIKSCLADNADLIYIGYREIVQVKTTNRRGPRVKMPAKKPEQKPKH